MRDDFAKLLTERERRGHTMHYSEVRHVKAFKQVDEYFGGHEGMKARHQLNWNTKSFNENLNPLKGWLRTCIGKKWDKCYSELRQKFDARKVVNNHILEHLYDFVEMNAYLKEGRVVFLQPYRYGMEARERPIKECYSDYYVCPKDGTLKVATRIPRRSLVKQREADLLKEKLAIKRELPDGSELHLIDGVWYQFTVAILPKANVQYRCPRFMKEFKISYFLQPVQIKTWDELNQSERQRFGEAIYDVASVIDAKTGAGVLPSIYKETRYFDSKRTASHKLLKQHGLDGALPTAEVGALSHRERAKYRAK